MSIVGTRPPTLDEWNKYELHHRARLLFLSRQKETYKVPYETHPANPLRQCVFGGTTNRQDFLPRDRTGNRRLESFLEDGDYMKMDSLQQNL